MNIVRASLIAEVTVSYHVGQYSSDYIPLQLKLSEQEHLLIDLRHYVTLADRNRLARNSFSVLLFVEREGHCGFTGLKMKTVLSIPHISLCK